MEDLGAQPLGNPEVDAIPPENHAQIEGQKPPINPPIVSEIPPTPEEKKQTCACRPDQTPVWKVVLDTTAVAVGIAAVTIYGCQLWAMSRTLDEMKRSG